MFAIEPKSTIRKLIFKILVFIIPFLILIESICRIYLVDLLPSEINCNKSIYNFESKCGNMDVLFLGHSFPYYGIDPDYVILENGLSSHNYSFSGEKIATTYYKIMYYLSKNKLPNLKLVVINIGYSNLFEPACTINSEYPYNKFYNYLDIIRTNPTNIFPSILNSLALYRVALQSDTVIKNLFFGFLQKESIQNNGYSRRDYLLSEALFNTEINNYIKADKERDYKINPRSVNYINKLLFELQSRNIKVIFVKMPTSAVLLASGNNNFSKYSIENTDILELKTEMFIKNLYPEIPLYNYLKYSTDLSIEAFSDGGHLNHKGAMLFSKKLAIDINKYLKNGK